QNRTIFRFENGNPTHIVIDLPAVPDFFFPKSPVPQIYNPATDRKGPIPGFIRLSACFEGNPGILSPEVTHGHRYRIIKTYEIANFRKFLQCLEQESAVPGGTTPYVIPHIE